MSKTSSYLRALAAGLMLGSLALAVACGDDDDDDSGSGGSGGTAGRGGSGGSGGGAGDGAAGAGAVEAIECGGKTCEPLDLDLLGQGAIAACCAGKNACGLDASGLAAYGVRFDDTCQARDQPGVLDPGCPDGSTTVPNTGLVLSFKGCCRPTGRCGYMLDKVAGVIEIGLGCVESEPFLDGETPESCDPAGAAGAGGAPGTSEGGAGGT
jgi:hypothetical protein